MKTSLFPRLSGWLVASVVLFALIALISPQQLPVVVYKLSLISLAAVLGYWLDRSLFPYARPNYFQSAENEQRLFAAALLRRAVIVAAVCLAVAMGL
ncbi:putative holin [Escherichia coli]|uniref:putative holin n=1 Tax=Escherichia coli TaxID=562 RepID=UPI000DEE85B0|nr:putative holin [Escherichia coli]